MDGYLISEMDLLFPLSTYPVDGVGGTGGIMFSKIILKLIILFIFTIQD